jgi:protocatechuate 3,4-dioxygenase alpha subunit
MATPPTASQTVGPFFHIGLSWLGAEGLAPPGVPGERVTVAGRVLDGEGKPVPDALLEIWEAGRRAFGRIPTDARGAFRFTALVPGRTPGPGGREQAPHLSVLVSMRGLLRHLHTRIYLPGQAANEADPVLALVEPSRRQTLVARRGGDGALEWNVVLQGEGETVFFDV